MACVGMLYHTGAADHCLSLHADAQTDSTMPNALLLCPDLYEEKKGNLGPDPLREDAAQSFFGSACTRASRLWRELSEAHFNGGKAT